MEERIHFGQTPSHSRPNLRVTIHNVTIGITQSPVQPAAVWSQSPYCPGTCWAAAAAAPAGRGRSPRAAAGTPPVEARTCRPRRPLTASAAALDYPGGI